MKSRRKFINTALTGFATLNLLPAINTFARNSNHYKSTVKSKIKLRYALASDGHYAESGTNGKLHYNNMVKWLNQDHAKNHLDFVIVNGDLVHDRPDLLAEVKANHLDKLNCPYYALPGNHDHADTATWKQVFGYEDNFVIDKGDVGFVLANTSNVKGNILPPDKDFVKASLDKFASKKIVFVVLHVPPVRWLKNEWYFFDFPETVNLLNSYPNVKAVFNGHDHSLDVKRMIGNIPCFFDSHIGGSWGTDYKGYRVVEVDEDDKIYTYQVNASQNPTLNSNKL